MGDDLIATIEQELEEFTKSFQPSEPSDSMTLEAAQQAMGAGELDRASVTRYRPKAEK